MTDNVVRLVSQHPQPVPRACDTCRHSRRKLGDLMCDAFGGHSAAFERLLSYGHCGPSGRAWEPRPEPVPGLFQRAWRFLFGYRPL